MGLIESNSLGGLVGAGVAGPPPPPTPNEVEVATFIASTQITDATIIVALDTLVADLKQASLLSKFDALYPVVGGGHPGFTQAQKENANFTNLINPAQYKITKDTNFNITHEAGGFRLFNGSNQTGFLSTGFLRRDLSKTNLHLSFWNEGREVQGQSGTLDFGNITGPTSDRILLGAPYSSNGVHYAGVQNGFQLEGPNANPTESFAILSSDTTDFRYYANGSFLGSAGPATGSYTNDANEIRLGSLSSGFINRRFCRFASIGKAFTQAEIATLADIVYKFQKNLGPSRLRGVMHTPGFNPLANSPIVWYDASDASTLYDATTGGALVGVNGAVARWEDKSGNNRHATQSTVANRPLRKSNVTNGLGALFFDGINDWLTAAGTAANFNVGTAGEITVGFAAVIENVDIPTGRDSVVLSTTNANSSLEVLVETRFNFPGRVGVAAGSTPDYTNTPGFVHNKRWFYVVASRYGGRIYTTFNGYYDTDVVNTNNMTNSVDLNIGHRNQSLLFGNNGGAHLGELLIYPTASATLHNDLKSYLARWRN